MPIIAAAMVALYSVGWARDPGSVPNEPVDIVNASAALYGLLWLPFGCLIWGIGRSIEARSEASF